jgi:hypothetical protein
MCLPWLTHDEAPGPYIPIPQYWFHKTKQHTLFDPQIWTDPGYHVDCTSLALTISQNNVELSFPDNTITVVLTAITPLLCTNERFIINCMG